MMSRAEYPSATMPKESNSTNLDEKVQQYTAELDAETTDVVHQAVEVVNAAAQAAEETFDVVDDLLPVFDALSRGKRAKAIDAALAILSDETSQEAHEAVAALKATRREINRFMAEFEDLLTAVSDIAQDIENEVAHSDLLDTVSSWF